MLMKRGRFILLMVFTCSCYTIQCNKNPTEPDTQPVSTPTFTPPPGTYDTPQSIRISCTTPGARIFYTTDDTDPTEADSVYTDPLELLMTTTLKARAFKNGWSCSNIGGGVYNIRNNPPIILRLTKDLITVGAGSTCNIRCLAQDYDGDVLSFSWQSSSGDFVGDGSYVTWIAPDSQGIHSVSCTVTDGRGGEVSESIEILVIDFIQMDVNYVVSTRAGSWLIDPFGNKETFISVDRPIEVYDDHVYFLHWGYIRAYDEFRNCTNHINIHYQAPYYLDFVILPDMNFALLDNQNDQIYFIDSQGNYLGTANILDTPDNLWQNTDGIIAEGCLILSDNGYNQILKVDLNSYEVDIFKDLSHLFGWIGAIDHVNGLYYLCQNMKIYVFLDGHEELLITSLPEENISGIVVNGKYAYVTVNFAGKIYRVDITTGEYGVFVENLDSPDDIERW